MTGHALAFSRRAFARGLPENLSPFENRGRGECRVPNAPAAWCAHSGSEYAHQYSQRRHRKHPAFPTQWFYGLYVISPATNSFCHRRPTDCMASHIPVGLSVPPRDLASTTDARTTRLHRPQHCRSSRAPLSTAHESLRPATSCAHDTVASTASRPTFVTIGRNAPLHRGGMGETIVVICPTPQACTPAADWHDGQIAHAAHARFARRINPTASLNPLGQEARVRTIPTQYLP